MWVASVSCMKLFVPSECVWIYWVVNLVFWDWFRCIQICVSTSDDECRHLSIVITLYFIGVNCHTWLARVRSSTLLSRGVVRICLNEKEMEWMICTLHRYALGSSVRNLSSMLRFPITCDRSRDYFVRLSFYKRCNIFERSLHSVVHDVVRFVV